MDSNNSNNDGNDDPKVPARQSDRQLSALSFGLEISDLQAASPWSLSGQHALGDTGPGTFSFFLHTCAPSKTLLLVLFVKGFCRQPQALPSPSETLAAF